MNTLSILKKLLKTADLMLVVSMFIGFILSCIFFAYYYHNFLLNGVFENSFLLVIMSVGTAVMVQLLRFSFALKGAYDWSKGNENGKRWGFGFSGAVTVYEIIEAFIGCAKMTENDFWGLYFLIFSNIVWSYLCEIRLTISMGKTIDIEEKKDSITDEKGKVNFALLNSKEDKIYFIGSIYDEFITRHSRKPILKEMQDLTGVAASTVKKYLDLHLENKKEHGNN